jgi:hypothetical protein
MPADQESDPLVPVKAGTQIFMFITWIPACAGMSEKKI